MSSGSQILIHIDNRSLWVDKGITILEAARQNGIAIPTLCDFPGLPSRGSCRLCIVEIQGRANTPTACTTPVEEGMVISTQSPKVRALRTELLQMLLAEHPSSCLFCPENDHCDECMVTLRKAGVTTGCGSCPKDGQCELQALAAEYGVKKPAYPLHYRMLPVEQGDPFFDRDDNLCILCGRCIRACEELHFISTLTLTRRGTHALVGTAFFRSHVESSCTFCGTCVEVCPTGALSEKTRKWEGKPERETATTCPLCSLGCSIHLLSKQERVIGSLPNRDAGASVLCVNGRFGITELVNHPSRSKRPQKRAGAFWQAVGWDEAIASAAERLAACPPERFELRISASSTSEDLYVAYRFARDVMKTTNLCTTAQARLGSGLNSAARLVQASQSLERIDEAAVILCLGLDDPYASSVVEAHLHWAKRRGAKIVHLSARKPAWSGYADVWLDAGHGQEASLIEQLAAPAEHPAGLVGPAADLLRQAGPVVILVGPEFLAHPDSGVVLPAVERLAGELGAQVIALPEAANLNGALRLGLCSAAPTGAPEVLYLIGEALPAELPGDPFVIYQNLYPPAGEASADLLLPTTAFSEEEGSFIDYAGQVRCIHPAVPAPGETLPTWMILSRIARQMGAQGFDFTCVEDIRRAAQAEFPGFPELPALQDDVLPAGAGAVPLPETGPCERTYLGISLVERVEGLRSLYPDTIHGGR